MNGSRAANGAHETVAVLGGACFRCVMTLDHAGLLNGMRRGWDAAMGLRWVRATADELVAELDVDERHRQRFMVRSPDGDAHGAAGRSTWRSAPKRHGLVHGGVYSGLIEVICSAGAAIDAMARGHGGAVGLENHTTFVRATRGGTIRGTARPITRGRRTHVWEAEVRDAEGVLLATGRVRLLVLERGETPASAKSEPTSSDEEAKS